MSQSRSGFIQPWLRLSTVLLLASVGLHGIVLSLPLPESQPELEASTEAETVAEAIDVVALPERPGSKPPVPEPPLAAEPPPQPAPQPAPSATQSRAPAAPVPKPDQARSSLPVLEPEVQPEPDPDLQPDPVPVDPLENPDSYAYNQKSSGSYNGSDEFIDWTIRLLAQGLQPEKLTEPIIEVAYPLSNCLTPEPIVGSLGVIITADGQVASKETLGSTGYDVLDAEALQLVETALLPTVDQQRAFSLPVVVQYEPVGCAP